MELSVLHKSARIIIVFEAEGEELPSIQFLTDLCFKFIFKGRVNF